MENKQTQADTVIIDTAQTSSNANTQIGIKCIQGNKSQHACMSKECNALAFVCEDDDCQCQESHQGCYIIKTSSVLKALNKKIVSVKPIEDAINFAIDKIIDNLSDFKDRILFQIKQKFQFCGLNDNQIKIIRSFRSERSQKITGDDFSKTGQNPDKQKQFLKEINKYASKIKTISQNVSTIIKPIQYQIEGFCKFQKDHQNHSQKISISEKIVHPTLKYLNSSFFQSSKIIKSFDQMLSMIYLLKPFQPTSFPPQINSSNFKYENSNMGNVFANKKPNIFEAVQVQPKKYYQTNLLYRASQNQFSITKFHELCDGIKNTLTLCQTTSGNIIGGYSPKECNFYPPKQQKPPNIFINHQESFIFSFTHYDKLMLKAYRKPNLFARQQNKFGPSFELGQVLVINDKANQNNNSLINLDGSYINQYYDLGNGKVDNQRFLGGSTNDNHFSLREWEVWQILFAQNK